MIARLHFRDARCLVFSLVRSVSARPASLMKLLALDTATEQMAVALCHGDRVLARNETGGAAASATLIPLVLSLLAEAGLAMTELDAIACGQGPGAFTGLRTAVSVTQGLAFGIGKPALCIDSLLIVAEDARGQGAAVAGEVLWVAMDARMDEVYAAAYVHDGQRWTTLHAPALHDLETLQLRWAAQPPRHVAGNAMQAFGERLPVPAQAQCWPQQADRAAALLRLARAAWADGAAVPPEQALPVYVRDKVALTTAERQALKASQA